MSHRTWWLLVAALWMGVAGMVAWADDAGTIGQETKRGAASRESRAERERAAWDAAASAGDSRGPRARKPTASGDRVVPPRMLSP